MGWHIPNSMGPVRSVVAYVLLISIYGFAWLVAVLAPLVPRRKWKPTGRIVVTGTFHNPNWYLSHVTPLVRSGVKEVILVVDEPEMPLEGVRFVCWPRWASRLLSRPGARAIWVMITGLHYRPDLYMGYHLGPGACTALVVGKLMGRPTCYQMTGGPVEIIGGGVDAVEGIGAPLGRPSEMIETMALAIVRLFELVVVRGSRAKEFLAARGIDRSVAIITGSVQNCLQAPENARDIHLIFIGRLSPVKQVDQFIRIVDSVRRAIPNVRAAIVGEGPLKSSLRAYAEKSGLIQNIEFLGKRKDVESFLARSKVFVLTSRSEGLSIAMAEAMAAGVVPVVANVGDLGDLVADGVSGYLIEPNNIDEYAGKAIRLLQDDVLWSQYSCKAIEVVRRHCAIEVVSGKWRQHLRDVVSQASGCCPQDVFN